MTTGPVREDNQAVASVRVQKGGEVAGVEGTPTFFIDGKRFNGVFELNAIAPIVQDELKR